MAVRLYATRIGLSTLVVAVIAAVGYVPTAVLAGDEAVWSMLAGCGASWIASSLGSVPLVRVALSTPAQQATGALKSMGLRFVAVLVLVVPLILSGRFDRTVLVFWIVLSYLVLLVVDSTWAIRLLSRQPKIGS